MSEVDSSQPRVEPTHRVAELQIVGVPIDSDVEYLEEWTDRLVRTISPKSTSLVVRVVDSSEMQQINRTYRAQDQVTDVLSFPGECVGEEDHLGDIVVTLPVAARQAQEHGHSLTTELETLVLHGVLHCMGYDHVTDDGEMDAREAELRREWIPSGACTND